MRRRPSPGRSSRITGICTVGLYIAYTSRSTCGCAQGDNFEPGPWNLGRHYRWINLGAIVLVIVTVVIF